MRIFFVIIFVLFACHQAEGKEEKLHSQKKVSYSVIGYKAQPPFADEFQNQAALAISQMAGTQEDRERIQNAIEELDQYMVTRISAQLSMGNLEAAKQSFLDYTALSEEEINKLVGRLSQVSQNFKIVMLWQLTEKPIIVRRQSIADVSAFENWIDVFIRDGFLTVSMMNTSVKMNKREIFESDSNIRLRDEGAQKTIDDVSGRVGKGKITIEFTYDKKTREISISRPELRTVRLEYERDCQKEDLYACQRRYFMALERESEESALNYWYERYIKVAKNQCDQGTAWACHQVSWLIEHFTVPSAYMKNFPNHELRSKEEQEIVTKYRLLACEKAAPKDDEKFYYCEMAEHAKETLQKYYNI